MNDTEKKIKLSAVIIAANEESRIEDCIRSVGFADEIIVVDGGSSDRTREIAATAGAKVHERVFDDFSSQKNFGIEKAEGEWILSIDADERISPDLACEIAGAIAAGNAPDGFWLKRINILFGRSMRFGACGNDYQLRLIKRGAGKFHGTIHERIQLEASPGRLKQPMLHYSYQNMREYMTRFDRYTSADAEEMLKRGVRPNKIRLFLKPALTFLYLYIFKLGFLDGTAGLKDIVLASYYVFMKNSKAMEYLDAR